LWCFVELVCVLLLVAAIATAADAGGSCSCNGLGLASKLLQFHLLLLLLLCQRVFFLLSCLGRAIIAGIGYNDIACWWLAIFLFSSMLTDPNFQNYL